MRAASPTGLVRGIRRWDLVAVMINAIIGAGIFGLPSRVFAQVGPYSLIAFAACGLVVMLIVLCFAEVGSRFDETGGPYLYAREAFGPLVGFEVGWLTWVTRVTAFAANCNLLVEYLGYFLPAWGAGWRRSVVITLVVVTLTAVNLRGVRNAAMVSNIFTVGKLLPIALFVMAGLFFLEPGNFATPVAPGFHAFSNSVLLLVYAFTGFEMATITSGEVRDPRRNLPFALLTSIGVVMLLYILIQVVCIGTLPALADSRRPLLDAGARFLGGTGAAVIAGGVLVSIFGNLNVLVLAASRLPFAMAGRGGLPRPLAATHPRFRTPHVAILLTAAVMLVLTLSGSFVYAVTVSTIARLLSYTATCAALPLMRRRGRGHPAHFLVPAGPAVAAAALLLTGWLLANSTWREARDAGIAAAAGLLVYAASRVKQAGVKNDESATAGTGPRPVGR